MLERLDFKVEQKIESVKKQGRGSRCQGSENQGNVELTRGHLSAGRSLELMW